MHISISKLAHVASIVFFGVAAFGGALFGHAGLELVGAGLALFAGGDLLEDIVSE